MKEGKREEGDRDEERRGIKRRREKTPDEGGHDAASRRFAAGLRSTLNAQCAHL